MILLLELVLFVRPPLPNKSCITNVTLIYGTAACDIKDLDRQNYLHIVLFRTVIQNRHKKAGNVFCVRMILAHQARKKSTR